MDNKKNNYMKIDRDGWEGFVDTSFAHLPISCLVNPDCSDPRRSVFEKVQSSDTAEVYRYTIDLHDSRRLLYLKKYPYRSIMDAVKDLFRSSRARRAFEAGRMLEGCGLHTPEIIAFLRKKSRLFSAEDILITQAMENATALSVVLGMKRIDKKTLTCQRKRSLISQLGMAIGQMHKAGIVHGDLRGGNVFIQEMDNRYRFIFIDNERTLRYIVLKPWLRKKNLVQLNMHQANASATDRMRFLKSYRTAAGLSHRQAKQSARTIIKATQHRFKRRARTRTGIADGSDLLHWNFQRARRGELDGVLRTDFAKADTAQQLLRQIEDLMATGTVLKNDITTRVVRCRYNGFDIVIKCYNWQGFWHALRHTIKGSRAKKCWRFGHLLTAAKIPCAEPLGMIQERVWGIIRRSYIINAYVEGPMLYTLMTSPDYSDEQKQTVRKKAEVILKQLAQHSMTHSDMKSVNMLVHENQPILIDLDSMQQHRFRPYFQLRNKKMRRKFNSRLYGRKK